MAERTPTTPTALTDISGSSRAVLIALRKIIRAADVQSKKITKACGLTPGQILVLRAMDELGEVTTGRLAQEVQLSQATVTTILDRLEKRALVDRYRSTKDRRIVHSKPTSAGRQALEQAPPLLHEKFLDAFAHKSDQEQQEMIGQLEEVARMLGGQDLDASPVLDL